VLDYKTANVRKWAEAEDGRRADVVIDCIGRQALADAWWVVKEGGTLISIFQPPEGMKPADLTRDVKNLFFIQEPSGEHAGKVGSLIDSGGFMTALDSVWPPEKFEEAVERMESGKARGKIVIEFVSHI
jgi:NADPH:quinone reductase-like Zn-dependent oxidoreductase